MPEDFDHGLADLKIRKPLSEWQDLGVRRLNGDDLIARLRADPKLAQLPIIAVSADGDEARDKSLRAGADLFLAKPVILRELCSTLERILGGRQRA